MRSRTYRTEPLSGFHSEGLLAVSEKEVMGDPCQLLGDEHYDRFMHQILRIREGCWTWVLFEGARISVLITGMDGSYYGTGTDTACIIRMKRKDWERLR